MPIYRVHRIKEAPGENFRWAAHTGGLAVVKAKDYESDGEALEAATAYAAWKSLAGKQRPLRAGDLLEVVTQDGNPGELQIYKYIGFEPAKWYAPETITNTESTAVEISAPALSASPPHPVESIVDNPR